MATHKHFDRICALALTLCLLLTLVLYNADALGIQAFSAELGYEARLFSTDRVHTIDIRIDDWESFLLTAQSEEYTVCDVVIDGETVQDVGLRGKGNTSLSTVSSMDSDRYSFKIEFDQYDSTKSYHGLDKLCLNNLIQDNTMMKDYLVYQMMRAFGAAAPLCSFSYLTVNGEDWGLYLAVEAVEDSFLRRNYGSDYGALYKPDSMNMGGGRGNGRDFHMEDWQGQFENQRTSLENGQAMPQRGDFDGRGQPPAEGSSPSALPQMPGRMELPQKGGFGGSMGSADGKLQYIDDDPSSYSSIFDSAKTDLTDADKTRLIRSLQALSRFDSSTVDVDAVIRYFVVHNFTVNGDSYTGSMVHNYYLYEKAGQLSMIPWDYNLAFGTFQGNNAAAAVNDDIDAPLSCTGSGDRPMMDWLLQGDQYTQLYHQYFAAFLDSVDIASMIAQAAVLIDPYVQKDPTKFCTYAEFQAGVAALKTFCDLRVQSVRAQLAGDSTPVDTGDLNLNDLGTMHMGGGFGRGQQNTAPPTGFPADFSGQRPAMTGMDAPGQISGSSSGNFRFLTGFSAAVLLIGLLLVWKYRR